MTSYIENQIAEREEKSANLDVKIQNLQADLANALTEQKVIFAEISTYKDVLEHSNVATKARKKRTSPKKGRLSPLWEGVIRYMESRYPNKVSYKDIETYLASQDSTVTPASIRAQMASYVNKEYVQRVEGGQFRATIDSAAKAGIKITAENKEPPAMLTEGSSNSEGEGRSGARLSIHSASGSIPDSSSQYYGGSPKENPQDFAGEVTASPTWQQHKHLYGE